MKRLNLDLDLLTEDENARPSSYCFIARGGGLQDVLVTEFGREGLCLKVFKRELESNQTLEDYTWGKVPLVEATGVQNLFALHSLAPRVYAVVLLNDNRPAQVTDFLSGREGEWHAHKIKEMVERYGIETRKWKDFGPSNWVGGKFVDFGEFCFGSPDTYVQSLVERAHTRRGENIGVAYQAVPEIGINGTRDLDHRLPVLKLDETNFRGKSVLDLGCNLGEFCRLACDLGARRVVGVDRVVPDLAYEISSWLGYWNIDFLDLSLPADADEIADQSRIGQFDIVFSMAVHNYMKGDVDWMADLCRGTFIFEGHGGDPRKTYEDFLHRNFDRVKHLGQTTDNYVRQVFRAERT